MLEILLSFVLAVMPGVAFQKLLILGAGGSAGGGGVFSDTFTRSDSSSCGANYSDPSSLCSISSNLGVLAPSSGSNATTQYTASALTDDQFAQFKVPASSFSSYIRVAARSQGAGQNTQYACTIGNIGDAHVYIQTVSSGSDTNIANAVYTHSANDIYRIEVSGSSNPVTITCKVNGSTVVSTTTSTVLTGGTTGFRADNGVSISAFCTGDIGAGVCP